MPDYTGQMVFNRIEKIPAEFDFKQLSEEIPYERESGPATTQQDENLEEIYLPSKTLDQPLPKEFFRILDEEVCWFRYTIREYQEEQGYTEDGNRSTYYKPIDNSYDLFVTSDGYIFYRAPRSRISKCVEFFHNRLNDLGISPDPEAIEFEADFLLWLLYQSESLIDISPKIEIRKLTDAEVVGEEDLVGSSNRVSGSANVTKSAPVLTGLLRGKRISMLGGSFLLDRISLYADIEAEGRIHIKSEYDFKNLSPEGRIVTSITFLKEFCELWDNWTQLDSEEKYPPTEFFREIYSNLERAGVQVISPDQIVKEYEQKREQEYYD
jgi:hypothetical protein